MPRRTPRLLNSLALLAVAVAALLLAGCASGGLLKSDGLIERVIRSVSRQAPEEVAILLTAPRVPMSSTSPELAALAWSATGERLVTLRFTAGDRAKARELAPGTAVLVPEGEVLATTERREVLATTWRARAPTLPELHSLLGSREAQCQLLSLAKRSELAAALGGMPNCTPRVLPTEAASAGLPSEPPAATPADTPAPVEVVEVRDASCRRMLWQVREELAAVIDYYSGGGAPPVATQPIHDLDRQVEKYLEQH